jgi:hypothetical protein
MAQNPQGPSAIVPIPGTTVMAHMVENTGAAAVRFTPAELAELNTAVRAIEIRGARLPEQVLDQLRSHMARARANGVTQQELIEAITHLAFYSGWPNAFTAVGVVAREVFNAETRKVDRCAWRRRGQRSQ